MPSAVTVNTTSARSSMTASARRASRGVVVVTASEKQPAARAACSPLGASSTTRQRRGSTPSRRAASRNGSGCGLPRVDVVGRDDDRGCGQAGGGDPERGQCGGARGGDGVLGLLQRRQRLGGPGQHDDVVDVGELDLVDPGVRLVAVRVSGISCRTISSRGYAVEARDLLLGQRVFLGPDPPGAFDRRESS